MDSLMCSEPNKGQACDERRREVHAQNLPPPSMVRCAGLLLTVLLLLAPLSGCILDAEFKGTQVASFDLGDGPEYLEWGIGDGTTATDDRLLSIELVDSTIDSIEFNDWSGDQDGADAFRFELTVRDSGEDETPTYACLLASQGPDACVLSEDVEDGVWSLGESVHLHEHGTDICSTSCRLTLTVLNADLENTAEEDVNFIKTEYDGNGPITHTYNFILGQGDA